MKTIAEVRSEVPVVDEVDVLVCGGGPAGFSAGLAAARQGARTLIVEQTNCLGGIATAGGHNHLCLYTAWGEPNTRVVGGIPFETVQRVVDTGGGVYRNGNIDFELDFMKLVMEQMSAKANLRLLYHTLFADAIVHDGRCVGAVIQNKSGRQAVLAKRVIDATGDADVAASAGCPWEKGRPSDGACQPATLMFTIGGVDWDRFGEFHRELKDWKLQSVWKKAQEAGDMEPFQTVVMGFWHTPTRPDQVGVNFTHIVGVDCTSAASITAATIEGRRQAFHMIPVFRKYVRGFERCYMISTAALLGTRESRRIVGQHVLTEQEILAQTPWPDSVCYGSFFIDIHNCTGPGMDKTEFRPQKGFCYQIPYRSIVPRKVDNLLVAGRCISVTHLALGSTRVMPQCAALGEAAGTAAAMSIAAGVTTSGIDPTALKATLKRNGAIVDDDGIVRS